MASVFGRRRKMTKLGKLQILKCRLHLPLLPSESEKNPAPYHCSDLIRAETQSKLFSQRPAEQEQGEKRNYRSHDCRRLVFINTCVCRARVIHSANIFHVPSMCHTHWLVSGSSAVLVLRNALHGPIQDRRHPIEQSLRKWLGCSEYPEVFGIPS